MTSPQSFTPFSIRLRKDYALVTSSPNWVLETVIYACHECGNLDWNPLDPNIRPLPIQKGFLTDFPESSVIMLTAVFFSIGISVQGAVFALANQRPNAPSDS